MLIETPEGVATAANDKEFFFSIMSTAGTISVNPKPPGGQGLLAGGHARIKKRWIGAARWLVWESSVPFQISFKEMDSDADITDGNHEDLFKETTGTPAEGGEGWLVFKGKLRGGIGFETIAYKYTVTIGSSTLDPLIIVDR